MEAGWWVKVINEVRASGKSNIEGCRISLPTVLDIDKLRDKLSDYDDRNVCEYLEFGWPINLEQDLNREALVNNHKGAVDYERDVDNFLMQEVEQMRVLGPFVDSPFEAGVVVSPLNSREKKDTTERRIILDLTYPGVDSVNMGIPKDEYRGEKIVLKYPTVDDFGMLIRKKGVGCVLFKRDLKKAYRQIPVDPRDIPKLAYRWKGKLYMDRVLSMGLRSAAYICQRVTNCIMYIFQQEGYDGVVYLDDFAGVAKGSEGEMAFKRLGALLAELGLRESTVKACSPSTRMMFLGITFDTERMIMQVTEERMRDVRQELVEWQSRTAVDMGAAAVDQLSHLLSLPASRHLLQLIASFQSPLSVSRRIATIFES
jgi:hypothetical protein